MLPLFLKSTEFIDKDFAYKKLADFLLAISFGFFPSKKWNGNLNTNGGLVIVKKDGSVVVLDLIYFKDQVVEFLINETKLDSPSSTRYKMLEIYADKTTSKSYFTLNLQIRYKK